MRFIDWLRQMAGREGVVLDDLPPSYAETDVAARIEAARREERAKAEQEFAEARKARDEELAAREERIRGREREARMAGIASFLEALQREGKVTPAMMKTGMGMTSFLEAIGGMETAIEFGEGDGKAKQTPLEFMEALLKGLPKTVEFNEIASAGKDPGAGGDAEKRERLVEAYMEKHPKATVREAVLTVSKENPELFEER